MDIVKQKILEYFKDDKKRAMRLKDWVTLNAKQFSAMEALRCIYTFCHGEKDEMMKVVDQLTEKEKVKGRSSTVFGSTDKVIDIVSDGNGGLVLKGYNPNKEPQRKGQKQKNPEIYRKKDDRPNKNYVKADERFHEIGWRVREIFPDESNDKLTRIMTAIINYANKTKKSPLFVVTKLKSGKFKYSDEQDAIIAESTGRTLVITESMVDELTMTEYKFNSNIKSFLRDLLNDPVNASPSDMLQFYGFNRHNLLKYLIDNKMVEKSEKINDKDGDGNFKKVTMKVSFKVPKKNFKHNLKKMFINFFQNTKDKLDMITEDGEGGGGADGGVEGGGLFGGDGTGATTCDSVLGKRGYVVQPVAPIINRGSVYQSKEKKKK